MISGALHTLNVERWKEGDVLMSNCENFKNKKTCSCCFAVAIMEQRPDLIANRFKYAAKYSLKNLVTPNKHNKKPGRKATKKKRVRDKSKPTENQNSYKKGVSLKDKVKLANAIRKKGNLLTANEESERKRRKPSDSVDQDRDGNDSEDLDEMESARCIVCYSDTGTLVFCSKCNTAYHPRCHKPRFAVANIPKGDWFCAECNSHKDN